MRRALGARAEQLVLPGFPAPPRSRRRAPPRPRAGPPPPSEARWQQLALIPSAADDTAGVRYRKLTHFGGAMTPGWTALVYVDLLGSAVVARPFFEEAVEVLRALEARELS